MKNTLTMLSQSEVYELVRSDSRKGDQIVQAYLEGVASSFSIAEVFDLIAYVDTPDVLG